MTDAEARANEYFARILSSNPVPVYCAVAHKTDGTSAVIGEYPQDEEPTPEDLDMWASARHDADVVSVEILGNSFSTIAWFEGRGYASVYGR